MSVSTRTRLVRIILLALVLAPVPALADVGMKIFTPAGHVGFTVAESWPVISMQSKLPIAEATFQIPDEADEGTPHSTNLVIMLLDPKDERARSIFDEPIAAYGASPPAAQTRGGWTIWRQEATQGDTKYVILDAKRTAVADVSVTVRLAWPRLAGHAAGHDASVEKLFDQFLESVQGHVGAHEPGPDDVIHRPR